MRAYTDFPYYSENFLGTELSEEAFPRYAKRASAIVYQMTFGRLADTPEIPDAVQDAVCAAAEQLHRADAARVTDEQGRELASENNDGYVVSFRSSTTAEAQEAQEAALVSVIRSYLANTGLLFRGTGR